MILLGALLAVVFAQAERPATGLVVDEAGKPVAEARVVFYAPPMVSGKENTAEARTTTDAGGRFQLEVPPLGRTLVTGVSFLVYRPGLAIAAAPYIRPLDRYILRKPEPRTIEVRGPDGEPIAGVRVAPRLLSYISGKIGNTSQVDSADIPESMAEPLTVTTGSDGRATLQYLAGRDQLVSARFTADSIGAQDLLLVDPRSRAPAGPVIAIRLKKTTRLTGRIMDETGGPVANQVVEVWSRGPGRRLRPSAVELTGGPLRTAANGSFRTPDNLMVGSIYRVVVRAQGKEPILSDWMTIGEQPRALLPMRLRPLRSVSGRVVNRQGKPAADVEVFQTGDGPEPTATRSGPDGRFSLGGFRKGPVFLFARGDGSRFHGQLVRDREDEVTVELTRTGEPPKREMRMLPEPVSLDESRAMARRLLEPLWRVVVEKGDDRAKLQTLEALANADPAGVLEKLESAKFAGWSSSSRLKAVAAAAMAAGDPEGAATIAESIPDPGTRAAALIGVIDALPPRSARASSPCSIARCSTPGRCPIWASKSTRSETRPSGSTRWVRSPRPRRCSPRASRSRRG